MRSTLEHPDLADLDVKLVELPRSVGFAAARNRGVDSVDSPFVIFMDDDLVAERRLVESHLAIVERPSEMIHPTVTYGVFVQPADTELSPWAEWEARQSKKEADSLIRGDRPATWRELHTANNCVPVATFRALGGFDERFATGEDDEFAARLQLAGCAFVFRPTAMVFRYTDRSVEEWLALARSYASSDVEIDQLHPTLQYLSQRESELGHGNPVVRVVRVVLSSKKATDIGVSTALAAGRLAHRFGVRAISNGALSIAYDLSYNRSMRERKQTQQAISREEDPRC